VRKKKRPHPKIAEKIPHSEPAKNAMRAVLRDVVLTFNMVLRTGWSIKRQAGSHKTLEKPGYPDYVYAFHDSDEIGPKMLVRVAKHTGLKPDDL
jgi:predicted RNA binding protein YcfA (HicA-like mRNA interferase family)